MNNYVWQLIIFAEFSIFARLRQFLKVFFMDLKIRHDVLSLRFKSQSVFPRFCIILLILNIQPAQCNSFE